MSKLFSAIRFAVGLGLGVIVVFPIAGSAQQTRDQQLQAAFDEVDPDRAVQLLYAALDPAAGEQDSVWGVGVQLMAQILLETGRVSLADTWLKWAARLRPQLQIDTDQFLPQVETAFRAAAAEVRAESAIPPDAVATSFTWGGGEIQPDAPGTLRVDLPGVSAPTDIAIDGVGNVRVGTDIQLLPGSYTVRTLATGFTNVEAVREVLPGASTRLTLNLAPVVAQRPAADPVAGGQTQGGGGGKFPWPIVAGVGAAGAVVAVLVLGGGGDPPPGGNGNDPPGSITITFPSN